MIRRSLITLLTLATTVCSWGAKADPTPYTLVQEDGKKLTVVLHGDEHFNYVTTTDGVLLVEKGKSYYIADILSDGSIIHSDVLAHNAGQRTAKELEAIGRQDRTKFDRYAQRVRAGILREPVKDDPTYFPHIGDPKSLVILADFTDEKFKNSDEVTKAVFEEYLNNMTAFGSGNSRVNFPDVGDETLNYNYGAVRRYFSDVSYGAFQPQFVVGAVVHLDHEMVYYGEGKNDRMDRFVPEVVQKAYDQGVDFSQFDSNNDGKVDLVQIIYAGFSASIAGNSVDCIWPKSSTINGGTFNGKQVYRYAVSAELNGNPEFTEKEWNGIRRINGIGVFCHEMSHTMGLPDIYPTSSTAQQAYNPSMEMWDIMDGGEYLYNGWCPSAYTAWEREAFGWMEIETLTEKGTITLRNIDKKFDDGEYGKAYRILNDDDETGHEYFIIQNIRRNGWNWKQYGHGMLMYHVDYDENRFSLSSNSVNNEVGHPRMTVVPAAGEYISSYDKSHTSEEYTASMSTQTFPGTKNITELLEVPVYTGGTMNKPLYNITEDTATGLVTFDFLEKSEPVDGITLVNNEKTNNKDYYTLDGRKVMNPTKGIYIKNGKKIIK